LSQGETIPSSNRFILKHISKGWAVILYGDFEAEGVFWKSGMLIIFYQKNITLGKTSALFQQNI